VGIGLGLGWRQMYSRDKEIQTNMSGVILTYKIKLFPGDLYKALFKKDKILEEKGDYRYQKYLKKHYKRLRRTARH
jgi:hypothetical protein